MGSSMCPWSSRRVVLCCCFEMTSRASLNFTKVQSLRTPSLGRDRGTDLSPVQMIAWLPHRGVRLELRGLSFFCLTCGKHGEQGPRPLGMGVRAGSQLSQV